MSLDIFHYHPRCAVRLEVPKVGSTTEKVIITPSVLDAKWTLNNHLVADELTVTMGWEESGCDPRLLKNATCEFFMWDDLRQEWNEGASKQYLRVTGICTKAGRKLSGDMSEVTMTFEDYTTLFLNMKPFPNAGMPLYSDTLTQIWEKLCDHTGAKDPDTGKIISSVSVLKKHLNTTRLNAEEASFTLGAIVNQRFHAIDKPSPHKDANAWEVWQWVVGALGLVSYIQGDECFIMSTTEHYKIGQSPLFMYGENILDFEENSNTHISGKGVMLKSYNHLTNRTLEAVYPPPGDDRLKLKQSVANRAAAGKGDIDVNAVSKDYDEFEFHEIQDQKALDRRAKEAYEEYSRQQMTGTLKTAELVLEAPDGSAFDMLNLKANDSIIIRIDPDLRAHAHDSKEAYRYLVDVMGYNDGLAQIISQNFGSDEFQSPQFHVTSMDVDYKDGTCMIELKYHNLVNIKGIS